MKSQNQDFDRPILNEDLASDIEAVEPRQADVENDGIGFQLACLLDCFAAVCCFPADLPVSSTLQERADASSHDFVIIYDEHSKAHKSLPGSRF